MEAELSAAMSKRLLCLVFSIWSVHNIPFPVDFVLHFSVNNGATENARHDIARPSELLCFILHVTTV